ncbi:MAG: chemotaxis protein CheW [Firmicutes bacterium]|nr:chemotaxis protein CheW [Bacillota bacterium]MDD4263125.1 chemotaxis protein CheW [Bacillota bacterium]MDD4694204.1 chemotaxis protein CheW [Bacillota bacterium]
MVVSEHNIQDEVQVVVFKLSNVLFASDIHQVKEIRRVDEVTPIPDAPDFVEGIIHLRGQIYPIINLSKRFQKEKHELTAQSRTIIIDLKDSQYGMIVDAVTEVIRIKKTDIEKTPELLTGANSFLEGVIKRDDQLILLVNLKRILTEGEIQEIQQTKDL